MAKRNQPCPCGSNIKYKKCCGSPQKRASLSVDPNSSIALKNQGLSCLEQRRYEEAANYFRKSLVVDPNSTIVLEKLGFVYFVQGSYEESVDCFLKSLAIDPDRAMTLDDLGSIYLKMRRYGEAVDSFNKALSVDHEYNRATYNLGLANQKYGKYIDAEKFFQKALSKNPKYAEALYGLGVICNGQERVEEAIDYFNKALAIKPDSAKFHIYLVIIYWLNGDWGACKNQLARLSGNKNLFAPGDYDFAAPYNDYLKKLLEYREANAEKYTTNENLPLIYVLGDSHCLSIANTRVNFRGVDHFVEAKIVIGCKAWHLGNEENNLYKHEFEKRVESIPAGATVILMFGEIDCRPQEGIIKHYKSNNNVSLTKSTAALVDNYFSYVFNKLTARDILPIICNIPIPDIKNIKMPEMDKELQRKVLSNFNQALEDHAGKEQLPVLDVYTLSKTPEEGYANKFHIDGVHLFPTVFEDVIKEL